MKFSILPLLFLLVGSTLIAQNNDDAHIEAAGANRQADNTATNDSPNGGCGNPFPDAHPCPKCQKETGAVASCPLNPSTCTAGSSSQGSISAYNGNGQRAITDLEIAGAPGVGALAFTRYSTTRLSNRNLVHSAFGRESSWSHNFEFSLRRTGTDRLTVTYPRGLSVTFKTQSTSSVWMIPTRSQIKDRLKVSGTDYTLDQGDSSVEIRFKQRTDANGGIFYRMESIKDARNNVTTISYDNDQDKLMRQITDASGRWIKLHYNDMGTASQVGDTLHSRTLKNADQNKWHEVNLTPGQSYRFLAVYQGNSWRQSSSLRITELEFYDENNNLITGTPYGSTPLAWNQATPAKAFDGSTTTWYKYKYKKGGYVGLDLGAGNASQVSKIRFYIKNPVSDGVAIQFVGQNAEAIPNWVISHIEGSDGREVGFSYDTFTDASGWFQWARLIGASYEDGADSTYTYQQTHDFVMPLLRTAADPRYKGALKQVRYNLGADTLIGYVRDEINDATGEKVTTTYWGNTDHKPKLAHPNGKIHMMIYGSGGNGLLEKKVDSYGFITLYGHNWRGHLNSVKDALNRTTTMTRDSRGLLTSVTTPAGKVTTYNRDWQNHIKSMTVNGDTTTHTRDGKGNITRTDHPDGTYETWTYNTFSQRLTHRFRNGHSESWTYDASGLKKSHTDAESYVTSYHHYGDAGYPVSDITDPGHDGITFNMTGRLAAMVDAHGNTTSYSYNDRGQVLVQTRTPGGNITLGSDLVQNSADDATVITTNTYDDYGNLLGRAVATGDVATDQLWLYTYDSLSRKLTSTDPLGRVTSFTYDPDGSGCGGCNTSGKPVSITQPDGSITVNAYDKEWRIIATIQAVGTPQQAITSYTYDAVGQRKSMTDALGHVTRWEYDLDGRVISVTRGFGTAIASTTSTTYDLDGNALTTTDAVGTITSATYDSMNRAVTRTAASGTATAATTSYTFNATTGELDKMTDPLGRDTTFIYDDLGRNIRTTLADGNFTETFYDALGRAYKSRDLLGNFPSRVYTSQGSVKSSTDAAGVTMAYLHDALGRTLTTTYPSGKTVDYEYDVTGNKTKVTLAKGTAEETSTSTAYDNMDRPLQVTDGEGKISSRAYDIRGRMTSSTDANGLTTSYSYDLDNQLLTVTAPDSIVTSTRSYDALHRMTSNKDGANRTTSYAYDAVGRMTSYTNAKGNTFSFGYDALGRKTSRTEPDSTSQSYTYDLIGRLTTHTKADGAVKTYSYANADRNFLTSISFSNGEPSHIYSGHNAAGQPASISNQHATITYSYDGAGRKATEGQSITGLAGTHIFSYNYNMDGQLNTHTRPDGSLVEYGYNARQLLSALTSDGPPPVADYTYNGRNQLASASVESGLFTRTRSYDDGGRLTSISQQAGGIVKDSTAYTLDNAGQRTGITRNGVAETYGYDAARQVTGSTISGQTNSYSYDLAGNRSSTNIGGAITNYSANTVNEYTTVGSTAPTHDNNGNLIHNGVDTTYTWDINNRMVQADKVNGDKAEYGYDALGRRVKRIVTIPFAGSDTYYLHNGWNVELEHNGTQYTKRRSWGLDLSGSLQGAGGVGGLVMTETLDALGNVTSNHYPLYDGNGNITALLDNSATTVATWSYDAYGNVLTTTGTPSLENYRFSTKPYDDFTGFYYYGYRYYDPVTGRWPSRDPLGDEAFLSASLKNAANDAEKATLTRASIHSVYGMLDNDALNQYDKLGLSPAAAAIAERAVNAVVGCICGLIINEICDIASAAGYEMASNRAIVDYPDEYNIRKLNISLTAKECIIGAIAGAVTPPGATVGVTIGAIPACAALGVARANIDNIRDAFWP